MGTSQQALGEPMTQPRKSNRIITCYLIHVIHRTFPQQWRGQSLPKLRNQPMFQPPFSNSVTHTVFTLQIIPRDSSHRNGEGFSNKATETTTPGLLLADLGTRCSHTELGNASVPTSMVGTSHQSCGNIHISTAVC